MKLKQAQIQSEVSNKMVKTTLDTMKAEGAQIFEMVESVPKPSPTLVKERKFNNMTFWPSNFSSD